MMADAVNQYGTTTEQVGVWVGCFCAIVFLVVMVLTGINQGNKLFRPVKRRRPIDERYVTRAELKASTEPLWRDMREIRDFYNGRCEELNKSVTALTVSAVTAQGEMRKMIDLALDPVEKKLDKLMISMAHVTAKLKVEADSDEN